jgi:hypothetical protein
MRVHTWLIPCVTVALAGLLLGGPLLAGKDPKPPPAPERFVGQYVLIEMKDGGLVILKKPQIRTLAGKPYVVGRTFVLPNVTNEDAFALTTQWIRTDNVRRMGEIDSEDDLGKIRRIALDAAERRQRIQEEFAERAKKGQTKR